MERCENMKTTKRLLAKTEKIWEEYNKHPFVLGIQNGDLDKEKFKYYIMQDYLYLEEYAKVFAIGMAKAKTKEVSNLFAGYINVLAVSEMDIHRGYMGKFNITMDEIESMPRSLDNLSYTSYMLRVAYEEGEAEVLVSILACALSYEYIAKKMLENNKKAGQHPFFGEWVEGYASEEYSRENKILIEAVEMATRDYSEEKLKHLEEIFVACSKYEYKFWEMSWNMNES